jgi:mucin-19
VTQPNAAAAGLVNVVVPQAVLRGGSALVVTLPESVTSQPGNSNASVNATLTNDRPLPSWIKYDAAQRTLVVESTPSTSLPVTVTLTVGGQRTNIVVTESGNVGR